MQDRRQVDVPPRRQNQKSNTAIKYISELPIPGSRPLAADPCSTALIRFASHAGHAFELPNSILQNEAAAANEFRRNLRMGLSTYTYAISNRTRISRVAGIGLAATVRRECAVLAARKRSRARTSKADVARYSTLGRKPQYRRVYSNSSLHAVPKVLHNVPFD